ncbi:protein FATTY ACID EXPORT 3, chloroplastic [Vigna radiata var. radiata]|uniref:Protein FATTY ACID EXPORT 3, chloroplastic n=1 Tax=Vigna radiata var. radiata TaxID=3916 RepID=A0A1S3TVD3_VIGRR|nr:protein FATTY ACID EXPORT 3, chloroplastic [Vigna radiata var. radiata]XP_022635548.1 protein FATTY ACID EXPORT 3, chloroplastic [Vigna radiata var. radiata]
MTFTMDSVSVLNPKLAHSNFSIPFNKFPRTSNFNPLLKPRALNAAPPNALAASFLTLYRRKPLTVAFTASQQDSEHGEIEVEKERDAHAGSEESQEAWKQTLDTFREQAEKFRGVSQDAYELYSKKAGVILKDTTVQLKVLADKTKHELSTAAKEITDEGKEYLSAAAESSPEVKDIVDTFTTPSDDIHKLSGLRDFYVGLPYGLLLSLGGFLSFMITGNLAAIRFGVILGGALLALSILSLRSYKRGRSSALALKGQAAIASILFLREIKSIGKGSSYFTALISGAVVAFFIYRIVLERSQQNGTNLETEPGN